MGLVFAEGESRSHIRGCIPPTVIQIGCCGCVDLRLTVGLGEVLQWPVVKHFSTRRLNIGHFRLLSSYEQLFRSRHSLSDLGTRCTVKSSINSLDYPLTDLQTGFSHLVCARRKPRGHGDVLAHFSPSYQMYSTTPILYSPFYDVDLPIPLAAATLHVLLLRTSISHASIHSTTFPPTSAGRLSHQDSRLQGSNVDTGRGGVCAICMLRTLS